MLKSSQGDKSGNFSSSDYSILRNRIEFLEKSTSDLKKHITDLKKLIDGLGEGKTGEKDAGVSDLAFNTLLQDFNQFKKEMLKFRDETNANIKEIN
mmetsp:Transcript_45743/g.33441  ORF Transcript_45743/g.33441 Transcript_45743/m.33441 type:complete len:96 (-) Transcript_45743:775-1062(-)